MAKNINIHIKTRGAGQTKEQLDGVGRSARRVGDKVESMGQKSSRAGGRIRNALGSLAGHFGFAAIAAAIAAAAVKVAKFFDELKKRSDEAARDVQNIRKEFESLFEARGAYTETGRQAITLETAHLLKETAVPKELGLQIIDAYTRQFKSLVDKGELNEKSYQKGLKAMLGYAARHGGPEIADLIAMMRGWGMVTPEQQGVFRRQIAAAAEKSGLYDADIIRALGRGQSTIKAMGWSSEQAVETIAVLAAGESGREKLSLPATTLQALMAPQVSNLPEYGISEELGQDPRQLLLQLQQKQKQMDELAFTKMLRDIYGVEGAAGVHKLLTAPRRGIQETLTEAAGKQAVQIESEEERLSKLTQQRRDARAKAAAMEDELDVTLSEQYEEDIREIGAARQKRLRRREPKRQWFRELILFEEEEKEYAAYRKWAESLSEKQRAAIKERFEKEIFPKDFVWKKMTPKEQFEALTGGERVPQRILTRPQPQENLSGPPVPEETKVGTPIQPAAKELPTEPMTVAVETEADTRRVEVPIKPVAKEVPAEPVTVDVEAGAEGKEVGVPVRAVAQVVPGEPVTVDVEADAAGKQVGVPVQAVAQVVPGEPATVDIEAEAAGKQVGVPVQAVAQEVPGEPVTVDVEAEAVSKQVSVPVQAVAQEVPGEPVTVDVEDGAEGKQVGVPVQAVAQQHGIEPSQREVVMEPGPMVINYNYDYSIRYYPRVGSDESGPRIEPGVMV